MMNYAFFTRPQNWKWLNPSCVIAVAGIACKISGVPGIYRQIF